MATFICIATGSKLSTNNAQVVEQYRKHSEAYKEVKTTTKRHDEKTTTKKAQPKQ